MASKPPAISLAALAVLAGLLAGCVQPGGNGGPGASGGEDGPSGASGRGLRVLHLGGFLVRDPAAWSEVSCDFAWTFEADPANRTLRADVPPGTAFAVLVAGSQSGYDDPVQFGCSPFHDLLLVPEDATSIHARVGDWGMDIPVSRSDGPLSIAGHALSPASPWVVPVDEDNGTVRHRGRVEANDLGTWSVEPLPGGTSALGPLPMEDWDVLADAWDAAKRDDRTYRMVQLGGHVVGSGPAWSWPPGAHCDPAPTSASMVLATRELWVPERSHDVHPTATWLASHEIVGVDDPRQPMPGCSAKAQLRAFEGREATLKWSHRGFTLNVTLSQASDGALLVDGQPVANGTRSIPVSFGWTAEDGASYRYDGTVEVKDLGAWSFADVRFAPPGSGFGSRGDLPGLQGYWRSRP